MSAAVACLGLAVLGVAGGGLAAAGPAAAAVPAAPVLTASAATAAPVLTASAATMGSGSTVTFRYSTPPATLGTSNWIGIYSAGQTPGNVAATSWQYALNASGTVRFAAASLSGTGSYDVYYLYNNGYRVLAGPVSLTVTGATPPPAPRFAGSLGGTGAGRLAAPAGVAAGAGGTVWVADRGASRVEEFSPAGRLVKVFGRSGPGALEHPQGIAIGPDGSVWVSDTGHDRVVEFTPGGREEGIFGSPGSGPGQLDQPEGLAVGPLGGVYVADRGSNRVEKFGIGGRFLSSIPVTAPAGVAITGTGSLWVSSQSPAGGAVTEFGPDGSQLADDNPAPAGHSLPDPAGIAIGPDGHIYVTQPGPGTVTVLNPDGSFYTRLDPQDLRSPEGIAVSTDGTVWVADTGHGRIAEYAPAQHPAGTAAPATTGNNRFELALLTMALLFLAALAVSFLVRRPRRSRKTVAAGAGSPTSGTS